MAQPGLFTGPDGVIADDGRGRIEYRPGWLPAAEAEAAFAELRDRVAWRSERRRMYERDVEVPRLLASYRLDSSALPAAIAALRERLAATVAAPFNAVGLNRYRDGRDSVAMHNDHLYEIAEGQPIALVSLGAAREMVIRAKAAPRRVLRVALEPGSLLLMSHATQRHYDHGIPKVDTGVGERISLAFRVKGGAGARH